MQFSGFIEASNMSTSADEVFDLLCQATSPLGYERVGFFMLTAEVSPGPALLEEGSAPIVVSNYPDDFLRVYANERRHEVDPLLAMARDNLTPLIWEDVVGRMELSEHQKLLCRERLDAGLHDEVSCPVHGPSGQAFAVRFARGQPGACDRAHLSALQVLAIHFYYAFTRHPPKPTETAGEPMGLADAAQVEMPKTCLLSRRERECMLWTARGKSASSISIILGLSENTINFYVKNAMKKLGTTNRVVAVVLAVRSGLIQP
jgi:LuxR family quorum-sensing system transcriptional regulator CciR